jgi:hypothetical protein
MLRTLSRVAGSLPYDQTVPAPPRVGNEALALLQKVRRDTRLPTPVRRRAATLAGSGAEPAVVLASLQQIAELYLPLLPRTVPDQSLARVTTAATFLRFYSKPEVRDAFVSVVDFVAYVRGEREPSQFLTSALTPNDPLFMWQRSWLAPARQVRGLSAEDTLKALEMTGEPPIVIFEFDREALLESGVQVRQPNSLDSVLGPNYQWTPTGLLSGIPEYVDGDLPRSALSRLSWSW